MNEYDPYTPYGEGYIPQEYAQTSKNQGLATASLVVGIISCLTLGLGGLGTIAGIVLGVIALRKAKSQPDVYGGKGFAIAGIITSVISALLAFAIIFAATSTIPQMIASVRMNRDENMALVRLRSIARSEKTYRQYVSPGKYATLEELHSRGLIDHGATRDGYRYAVNLNGDSFEAIATPEEYGVTGRISFYVSADGVIHLADKKGTPATAADPTATAKGTGK